MFDINAKIQELLQKRKDESIVFDMPGTPPKAKITIEIPGQAPIILDEIEQFMVFHKVSDHTGAVGVAKLTFLLRTFYELKEKIEQALRNRLEI